MSDNQDAPKSPEYHPAYDDPATDIVLVSQDGQKFRVHSYQLKSASAVFRDMLSLPPPHNPAADTGKKQVDLEADADDIKTFLDLMHTGRASETVSLAKCGRLVDLANKFDCPVVLRSLAAEVVVNSRQDPWKAFCMAGRLKDHGLAEKLIPDLRRSFYAAEVPRRVDLIHSPLRSMTFQQWKDCPPELLYGLVQGMLEQDNSSIKSEDLTYQWHTIGPLFLKHLPKDP